MSNGLAIFKGIELEILTKEDVRIEFNGECLFNGKQVCGVLEYINDRDAIGNHIRENQKVKLKNSDVANDDFRKLNNAGETFITEKGVMKLIIGSNMPKADEFEDRVWEIVTEVQKTGRYDSVERQLKLIEDSIERDLKISIYQIGNILKNNPNDMLLAISYNQKKQELITYEQNKKIENLESKVEDATKKIENMVVIGDRKQFTNEVNSVARAIGKEQADIYTYVYKELENEYGIDLSVRCKNKKQKLQDERLAQGKKALSPSTLKQKINNLTIADEEELFAELGKCLFAVKNRLLKKNPNNMEDLTVF